MTSERSWSRVLVAAGVGLLTGALTQLGQSALPDGWSQAANSLSVWLLVAFLLGAAMPTNRWAAAAGVIGLAGALVGYYGVVELRFGYGGSTGSLLFWGIGALVGGPVFGVAGRTWRADADHRRRAAAIGLLAAVFIAEGLYLVPLLSDPRVGAAFVTVGVVIPLVLGRSRADRLGGYVAILPMLVLGALGYLAFIALYGVTAGIG